MHDLRAGLDHLWQGQRWVLRHGRRLGRGLLPGLITLVVYAAALTALAFWADNLVAWATPFADGWGSPWLGLFRGILTAVLWCLVLLLAVVSFTAVTLLIGQPFYESLSEEVEREADGVEPPTSGLPLWRELLNSARESLAILIRLACYGVLLFAAGFLPVVGQTVVPAIGFCVTGFFLTEELAAVALQRRGIPLHARRALLRSRRMLTLGFGVPLVLLFLVPVIAVLLMPGAVAGATLLARDLVRGEDGGAVPPAAVGRGHDGVGP